MPEPKYDQLTPEEYTTIQDKMNKILDEHNCDMLVQSTIQILKRKPESIPSPYKLDESDSTGKENNTPPTTEEGS